MLQRSRSLRFITKIFKVAKPPMTGYEIAELPNEKVLQDFLQHYRSKGVLVILHSGPSYAATSVVSPSPLTSSAVRSSSNMLPASGTVKLASAPKPTNNIVQDSLTRSFISSMNAMNLGNPAEVKLALVPGPQAPRLVDAYNVITYPTTLLFMNGQCVFRVVGARTRELSIKSLFMLRNSGRNIFSRQ